jgi:hypothetical protein
MEKEEKNREKKILVHYTFAKNKKKLQVTTAGCTRA